MFFSIFINLRWTSCKTKTSETINKHEHHSSFFYNSHRYPHKILGQYFRSWIFSYRKSSQNNSRKKYWYCFWECLAWYCLDNSSGTSLSWNIPLEIMGKNIRDGEDCLFPDLDWMITECPWTNVFWFGNGFYQCAVFLSLQHRRYRHHGRSCDDLLGVLVWKKKIICHCTCLHKTGSILSVTFHKNLWTK